MKQFLEKYLKVYVHEFSRFVWICSIFFVIFFVTAIFRTYVDAAFLKRYGPQYIPWMLVINALLTFVVFGFADRLARRFTDPSLLTGFLAIYAGSVTVLFFSVKGGADISYPILYQLLYLLDSVLLVYLWNIAGDLFDARQGKRLFPLITASQVLGTTLGSFATKPVTMLIGEDQTLLIFAAACMGTALFLISTAKGHTAGPRATTGPNKVQSRRIWEVPRIMAEYPMIRYLIVTGLIPNMLLPILLYQFNVIANHTFESEQSLISFLSIFRGLSTSLTFVLLFFVGRLYQSMGIANASLVQPINYAFLFGGLTALFNIFMAGYAQFTTILIQRAVAGPVSKILFNIVPSDLAVWSRTFIRGTVLKVGMLTGSILMIVLKPVVSAHYLSIVALALSLYWVLESFFFRKHYARMLKQVIAEKQIDFDQIESVRTFDSGGAAMELGPVSVETRPEDLERPDTRALPDIEPEVALKLLEDPNPGTRAEAAASFVITQDIRAVEKLIRCLSDTDEDVRKWAMEALMAYSDSILPFLEVALIEAPPRAKQGILEVVRVSGLKDFELIPFLGKELGQAYANLIAMRRLESINGSLSVQLLKTHLEERNEEILSLIFYALWVNHADMRLMYQALKSETASIAVELVENSVQKDVSPYLIPLIEDIPLAEKIERGRRLFPLMRNETVERILTVLASSEDPLTRMLALFVIGEKLPDRSFIPIIQTRSYDPVQYVREISEYALKRTMNEVADMPDTMEKITRLRDFSIFEGMGIRELHAIASVITAEDFAPGDIMIKEGEENSSIYMIVSGEVVVYDGYGTEKQKQKVSLGPGSFLGELSLFTRLPPNATCVAGQNTKAYVLRHHQFQEIMKVYPQIGINLCRFFTMKLRQIQY